MKQLSISQEEFNQFHLIDRSLYNIMVMKLHRDPLESIQVHALFLWLESKGCVNLVHKLLRCPSNIIALILDEAVLCLNCIDPNHNINNNNNNNIPMLQGIIMNRNISLQFFHENRQRVQDEITSIISTVCLRALSDIASQDIEEEHHRTITNVGCGTQQRVQRWPDGRTLFMTFSKGYPLSEGEVMEFLTKSYGDCVESIHMQQVVPPKKQPLHAHIVLRSASLLELILGPDLGVWLQFTIHGKDARVRRFDTDQHKPFTRHSSNVA